MTGTVEVRAELLSAAELDAHMAQYPLVYIPLGSLEFHGSHLPIGLDALTAHGVCVRAARVSGGVVLPAVYQGTGGLHGQYPWSIMMATPAGIRAHLVETLVRLERFGVRGVVLFTGHFAGEQVEFIQRLADEWNGQLDRTLHIIATSIDKCPTSPIAPDHAGIFETTLLHALHPELVHVGQLPTAPIADAGDQWGSQRHDPRHPLWGVFGSDPRESPLDSSADLLGAVATWLAGLGNPSKTTGSSTHEDH